MNQEEFLDKIEDLSDDAVKFADKAFKEQYKVKFDSVFPEASALTMLNVKNPMIAFWHQKFDEFVRTKEPEVAKYRVKKNYYNYWFAFQPQ